jgi:hypothetical protein
MATEVATDLEQHVAAAINAERAAAGLPELKVEAHLNASAQAHSEWMGETGTFSHVGEGGSSATERIEGAGFPLSGAWQTAENLAYISISGGIDEAEVDRMHEGLMESDGHRANILDPDAAYVGVGLAPGTVSVGGVEHEVVFLTEHFADTEGEVLVQEEVGGQTMLQPYQEGEPVGEPVEADAAEEAGVHDEMDEEEARADADEDEEKDAGGSGGGCFVATAAYGSGSHPDVVDLRRFRDEVLVRHAAGRAFIGFYAAVGPRLAAYVSPRGRSGRVARALIAPVVRLARRRS